MDLSKLQQAKNIALAIDSLQQDLNVVDQSCELRLVESSCVGGGEIELRGLLLPIPKKQFIEQYRANIEAKIAELEKEFEAL